MILELYCFASTFLQFQTEFHILKVLRYFSRSIASRNILCKSAEAFDTFAWVIDVMYYYSIGV